MAFDLKPLITTAQFVTKTLSPTQQYDKYEINELDFNIRDIYNSLNSIVNRFFNNFVKTSITLNDANKVQLKLIGSFSRNFDKLLQTIDKSNAKDYNAIIIDLIGTITNDLVNNANQIVQIITKLDKSSIQVAEYLACTLIATQTTIEITIIFLLGIFKIVGFESNSCVYSSFTQFLADVKIATNSLKDIIKGAAVGYTTYYPTFVKHISTSLNNLINNISSKRINCVIPLTIPNPIESITALPNVKVDELIDSLKQVYDIISNSQSTASKSISTSAKTLFDNSLNQLKSILLDFSNKTNSCDCSCGALNHNVPQPFQSTSIKSPIHIGYTSGSNAVQDFISISNAAFELLGTSSIENLNSSILTYKKYLDDFLPIPFDTFQKANTALETYFLNSNIQLHSPIALLNVNMEIIQKSINDSYYGTLEFFIEQYSETYLINRLIMIYINCFKSVSTLTQIYVIIGEAIVLYSSNLTFMDIQYLEDLKLYFFGMVSLIHNIIDNSVLRSMHSVVLFGILSTFDGILENFANLDSDTSSFIFGSTLDGKIRFADKYYETFTNHIDRIDFILPKIHVLSHEQYNGTIDWYAYV